MIVSPFPILNEKTAPAESQPILSNVKKDFGVIPNLEAVMAQSPCLLASYAQTWAIFQNSIFDDIEQQIIYMTINFENNCEYCVPWHTKLSEIAGMASEDIDNLRCGRQLSMPKHNALHQFTKTMVRTRGSIAPADLNNFYDAGYTEQHALDVVLGIAIKTMSNFTNAIAQTPLDNEVKTYQWQKPTLREK